MPYKLISEAHSQENSRALAFFIALKKCHRNGVFYNYTLRSIAKKLGCSHGSVRNHIKTLLANGLVEIRQQKNGRHQLILKGYKTLTKLWGRRMAFIKYGDKKDIYHALFGAIAIENISRQEYNCRRKLHGCNRKLETYVESASNYASLSERHLARLLKTSTTTANRLKIEWVKLGLLKIFPMWELFASDLSESDFKMARVLGFIPIHAKYERISKKVFIRKADSVSIVGREDRKVLPKSWIPDFIAKANLKRVIR